MLKELIITSDGSHSISIPSKNITFHSRHGAIQESRHVFIDSGLRPLLFSGKPLTIFELGFGTGLNALLTAIEAEKSQVQISYNTIEPYPLEREIWQQLNYCSLLQTDLNCEELLFSLHDSPWNTSVQITPCLDLIKFNSSLHETVLPECIDLFYFDAFAPEVQPELWTQNTFTRIAKAMTPGGVFATYCSKSSVRKDLTASGFQVEKIPGPYGKREILRAKKL